MNIFFLLQMKRRQPSVIEHRSVLVHQSNVVCLHIHGKRHGSAYGLTCHRGIHILESTTRFRFSLSALSHTLSHPLIMVVTISIAIHHDLLLRERRGGIFASPHNITIVLSGARKKRYVVTVMNVFKIDNVQVDKCTCWHRCFAASRDVSFHVKQQQRGRHTSMSVSCS